MRLGQHVGVRGPQVDADRSTVLAIEPDGRHGRVRIVAAAHLDGEHVGWLTDRGGLVPPEHVLRPPAA